MASAAPHVVLFPWPEQGHLNPALAVADFLLESGIGVILVLPQTTHAAFQQSCSQDSSPLLQVEMVPDLPPAFWLHAAATEEAVDLLLDRLMQQRPSPSCLLVDAFYTWSHSMAVRHSLPRVEIWCASASAFTVGLYVPELVAKGILPVTNPEGSSEKLVDFIPGLTPFGMMNLPAILTVPDLGDAMFKFFISVVQHSKDAERVLAHTVYEIEHQVVDALMTSRAIRMEPIGPLFSDNRVSFRAEDNSLISWLDLHPQASVLYVAFGSVFKMKADDLIEFAHGLAASGHAFLWVRRVDDNTEEQPNQKLKEAFSLLEKQGTGRTTSWAPQTTILKHRAVGGFLSHCGWNSSFESLHFGVPILGLPLAGEQHFNLKLLVNDWKVGLALQEPNDRYKPLQRATVEKKVRMILSGEEGRHVRESALKWSRVSHNASHASSRKNLQKFVDDVKQGNLTISSCN